MLEISISCTKYTFQGKIWSTLDTCFNLRHEVFGRVDALTQEHAYFLAVESWESQKIKGALFIYRKNIYYTWYIYFKKNLIEIRKLFEITISYIRYPCQGFCIPLDGHFNLGEDNHSHKKNTKIYQKDNQELIWFESLWTFYIRKKQ